MVPLKEHAGNAYATVEHCVNSKGDVFFIDYSMQFGYHVDVGLFLPAACFVAAFSCVLPACGAAPSPCGLALSAELWRYPGICVQSWIVDVGFGGLYLLQCESCLGLMTFCGSFLWIVSPCGLMALMAGCCSCFEDLGLMVLKDGCSSGYGVFEGLKALLQGCCPYGAVLGPMALMVCCYDFFGSSVAAAIALLYFSTKMKQHAAAAEAAANEGMHVSESLLTSAAVVLKNLMVKKAQQAAAVAAAASFVKCNVIIVVSHVFAFHWTLLGMVFCIWVGIAVISAIWSAGFGKLSAASRALGKDLWSVSGKWKKQSAPNGKKKTNDVALLQALTQVEAYDCTDFKGWNGHSIDGSPSLGKGQATGRVDVTVDAITFATSFDYVDVALLHRSPQCVVLVNQGSHVEKKEKTVFVKGVEGKTRRRVVDSTQIWELLDEGIDMWVAVNGKRVDRNATMAQIGIHDQDTIRCYGRGLNGSDSHHKTFRVSGHAHCVGRNGCGPQKIDAFNVEIRNIMNLFLLVRSLVQLVELHKECLPRIRLSGEMVVRLRFLVNMCLLWFCHSSLQLKMLGPAMLFRGLLVCVSIWCENC